MGAPFRKRWAFFRKLGRHGASNESMRTFVATLRTHAAAFGADASDERIWTILRRLQILVFDFSAEHGQSDALVRERCVHALDPSERDKAGSLWSVLCDIAQNVADSGGEIAAETLRPTSELFMALGLPGCGKIALH